MCEQLAFLCYNNLMKKLTEIKIRITEMDKAKFKKTCGERGMSRTLQQFIKLHTPKG